MRGCSPAVTGENYISLRISLPTANLAFLSWPPLFSPFPDLPFSSFPSFSCPYTVTVTVTCMMEWLFSPDLRSSFNLFCSSYLAASYLADPDRQTQTQILLNLTNWQAGIGGRELCKYYAVWRFLVAAGVDSGGRGIMYDYLSSACLPLCSFRLNGRMEGSS